MTGILHPRTTTKLLPKQDLHNDHTGQYAQAHGAVSQGPTLDEELQTAEGEGRFESPPGGVPDGLSNYPIPSGQP